MCQKFKELIYNLHVWIWLTIYKHELCQYIIIIYKYKFFKKKCKKLKKKTSTNILKETV